MPGAHAVAVRYTCQQVEDWLERAFCLLSNIEYPSAALYHPTQPVYCSQDAMMPET